MKINGQSNSDEPFYEKEDIKKEKERLRTQGF